jgi:RimJ/RimL family protein N-acetyltransferase
VSPPPASDRLPWRAGRVTLRRLRPDDVARFQAYRGDPDVGRYQGWEPMSDDDARGMIAGMAAAPCPTPGDWVQIAIADAATDTLIGDIGLRVSESGEEAELGITLAPDAQGRGLAEEAVRALIAGLRADTGVRRLVGITDARNAPSARLLERIGMSFEAEEETTFRGEACVERRYALTL